MREEFKPLLRAGSNPFCNIGICIADIRESGHLFKVYGTWYRIYSDYVKYQGMRVNLKKGIDGNNIDISLYSAWTVGGQLSESRIMAGKLYDKLHEI